MIFIGLASKGGDEHLCLSRCIPWRAQRSLRPLRGSGATEGWAALQVAPRLEPEVANASSVPRQVLPLFQSIEVIDREVGYGSWLGQTQIHCNATAALFVRLQ
jgi:hypothetical protein